jgi:BirA family biotin operon repressor/biotin-[acetyl-CoA-carboxylase] ligase
MSSRFDVARFERLRAELGCGLGSPLTALAVTGSTNDDALAAARGGSRHGATFVADHQTNGRGRRGRAWIAEPGDGLLVSVVLRPELEPSRLGLLPLTIGLAVRAAVSELLPPELASTARVKWPNDVWASGKKIAGVLAESRLGATGTVVVAGVGINLWTQRFPPELEQSATSFARLGVAAERETLLAGVLKGLEMRLGSLSRGADEIVSELRQQDGLRGRRVRVDGMDGIASGIDSEGHLTLQLCNGDITQIHSGQVELLDS